jgi:hypothetical protein
MFSGLFNCCSTLLVVSGSKTKLQSDCRFKPTSFKHALAVKSSKAHPGLNYMVVCPACKSCIPRLSVSLHFATFHSDLLPPISCQPTAEEASAAFKVDAKMVKKAQKDKEQLDFRRAKQ